MKTVSIQVPMDAREIQRFDRVCGRGAKAKRGAWVREAILTKLAVEEMLRSKQRGQE